MRQDVRRGEGGECMHVRRGVGGECVHTLVHVSHLSMP